jgi:deazaflavin-dependent oxidoreductase (nitroreductase family)
MLFWRIVNPGIRALADISPWWVVLETTGRRSGEPRQVPLAKGPIDASVAWLIAVHGEHSSFAHNISANPRVRLKVNGRWRSGTAGLAPYDPATVARFNAYGRIGPKKLGIEPKLLRIDLDRQEPA